MCQTLRILFYRLWALSTCTIFFSLISFWVSGVLLTSIVLIIGILGILYNAQDLLLYYPYDPPDSRMYVIQPSKFNLPFESIKLMTTDGIQIHLFLILQATDSNLKPTMIFFHGNAGNMGQRLLNASGIYHNLNVNVLLVEYRGYGFSEGTPSEQGLYIDAQCAFEYIFQRNDIDRAKIIVFGRSLGGAVAIDLASRPAYCNRIWALIVENTFTSVPDMARFLLQWWCIRWLPNFCHKNKFASSAKVGYVRCPTMLVVGREDELVPGSMGRTLAGRCGARLLRFASLAGGHNDTWVSAEYYPELASFLALAPPLQPQPPLPQPPQGRRSRRPRRPLTV